MKNLKKTTLCLIGIAGLQCTANAMDISKKSYNIIKNSTKTPQRQYSKQTCEMNLDTPAKKATAVWSPMKTPETVSAMEQNKHFKMMDETLAEYIRSGDALTEELQQYKIQQQSFFESLKMGRVGAVREYLLKNPTLANEISEDGVPPIIVALQFHHKHERGHAMIDLLNEFGADFNALMVMQESMPCDMTPLAFAIFRGLNSYRIVEHLIQKGGNIHHESVTTTLQHAKQSSYLDHPIMGSRTFLDQVIKLRGESCLESPYRENDITNFDDESVKQIRDVTAYYEYLEFYHHPKRWMRPMGVAVSDQKYDIAGILIEDEKKSQEMRIYAHPVGEEATSNNWIDYRFKDNTIPLIFGVLMGRQSPKEVFDFMASIYGGGFEQTNVGNFLANSPGHDDACSSLKKRVIGTELEKYIRERCRSFTLDQPIYYASRMFFNNIQEVSPKLTYDMEVENNDDSIIFNVEDRGSSKCPIFISNVLGFSCEKKYELHIGIELIHTRDYGLLNLRQARSFASSISKETYVFDHPMSQALVLQIICGKVAPSYVEDNLHRFFGKIKWDENTQLGQFLSRLPGFEGFTSDEPKAVVGKNIVNHFYGQFLWGGYSKI